MTDMTDMNFQKLVSATTMLVTAHTSWQNTIKTVMAIAVAMDTTPEETTRAIIECLDRRFVIELRFAKKEA